MLSCMNLLPEAVECVSQAGVFFLEHEHQNLHNTVEHADSRHEGYRARNATNSKGNELYRRFCEEFRRSRCFCAPKERK